jgi:hypothetical protein
LNGGTEEHSICLGIVRVIIQEREHRISLLQKDGTEVRAEALLTTKTIIQIIQKEPLHEVGLLLQEETVNIEILIELLIIHLRETMTIIREEIVITIDPETTETENINIEEIPA